MWVDNCTGGNEGEDECADGDLHGREPFEYIFCVMS